MSMSKQFLFLVGFVLMVSMTTDARRFYSNRYRSKLTDVKTRIQACQGMFLCDYMSTSTMCTWKCVDNDKVCNGMNDCMDGADEMCPPKAAAPSCAQCEMKCSENEFTCRNGTCIPIGKICDGTNDCGDDSDETGDICDKCTCDDDNFQCYTSKTCIPRSQICDGHKNCADGSDEPDNCECEIDTNTISFCGDTAVPRVGPDTLAVYLTGDINKCINACKLDKDCKAVALEPGVACFLRTVDTVEGGRQACDGTETAQYHLCDFP